MERYSHGEIDLVSETKWRLFSRDDGNKLSPVKQHLSTASICLVEDLGDGWQQVDLPCPSEVLHFFVGQVPDGCRCW